MPDRSVVTNQLVQRFQRQWHFAGRLRRYLVRERGLVPTTVRAYIASANGFLAKRLEAGEPSLERLSPREVTEVVLAECRRRKPGSAKRWLTELRSLLRFLEIEGRTRTGLLQAVPAVPGWKGVSLPRYLTADDVARLFVGCDQGSPVGRRDFAIIILLARLGLRSLEVANLTLDDIDWRRGEIAVHARAVASAAIAIGRRAGARQLSL